MKNRALSVHQEHELLMKLEQAGLNETGAQAIIESRGNALAKKIVDLVRGGGFEGDWFSFTATTATLKELRDRNPDVFCSGNDWWLDQPFANQKGKAGQLQLRTSVVPGSFSKNWNEQQELLADGEFVPTVRDLVEGMIAYHQVTGGRLSSDYWVRTQDVSSRGHRVIVRFFSDGVNVINYWDDLRDSNLGLAVARKSV